MSSLVNYGFFPRSTFDMDSWYAPTLDIFDPFDEIDNALSRNLQWLTRPAFLQNVRPIIPRKYRVTVDVAGFKPESIKTNVANNQLTVSAKEDFKDENGDFSTKEFKKTYKLPANCEPENLVSFVTRLGQLVVEMPLKESRQSERNDLLPMIEGNQVKMQCSLPKGIDPEKISVTCKDQDLIIKAEDTVEKADSVSKVSYYKRCTMPRNTDFSNLKCKFDGGNLSVEAPVNLAYEYGYKKFPIEFQGKQQQQIGQ